MKDDVEIVYNKEMLCKDFNVQVCISFPTKKWDENIPLRQSMECPYGAYVVQFHVVFSGA